MAVLQSKDVFQSTYTVEQAFHYQQYFNLNHLTWDFMNSSTAMMQNCKIEFIKQWKLF